MAMPEEVVRHIMNLARLKLPESEVRRLREDLESILDYVEQLKEVDVTGVPAMAHAVPASLRVREDAVERGIGPQGLAGSAGREGRFVRVPRIVE